MAIKMTSGDVFSPPIYSDSTTGKRDCASKTPNIIPPTMIKSTELVSETVLNSASLISEIFTFRVTRIPMKAAKVPMAPASMGVKTPE